MKLTQSGSNVSGTYPHDQGRLSGTVGRSQVHGPLERGADAEGPGRRRGGRVHDQQGRQEAHRPVDVRRQTHRSGTRTGPARARTARVARTCPCRTAGGGAAPGRLGQGRAAVAGVDWGDTAVATRNQAGPRFVYVCPAAGRKDQVWGTDVYADASSVCSAALHAGAIVYENGGIVTIERLPGTGVVHRLDAERDHERELGRRTPGSFRIVSAVKGSDVPGVKMGGAGWTATAQRFRGQNGGATATSAPAAARPRQRLRNERLHRRQLGLRGCGTRRPDHARERRPGHDPDRPRPELLPRLELQRRHERAVRELRAGSFSIAGAPQLPAGRRRGRRRRRRWRRWRNDHHDAAAAAAAQPRLRRHRRPAP